MIDLSSLILMNFHTVANFSLLTQCHWKFSLCRLMRLCMTDSIGSNDTWVINLYRWPNCPLKCLRWLIKVWISSVELSQLYKLLIALYKGKTNISDPGTVTYLTNTVKRNLLLPLLGLILNFWIVAQVWVISHQFWSYPDFQQANFVVSIKKFYLTRSYF